VTGSIIGDGRDDTSHQECSRSGTCALTIVTLYLTERCNSRCVSCDYWRYGKTDASVESVARLIPDLHELQTQVVLSGGEPLLHPNWIEIAELLRVPD
jgi:MoaA/NifB/PqqE/SkfB family radical SAM enzyme